MKWIKIYKEKEIVIITLIKFKEDNLWSFVNLTKGHICKCKFSNIEEALEDLNIRLKNSLIKNYEFFELSDSIQNLILRKESFWDGVNCSNCGTKVTEGLDAQIWNYWLPKFCPHCGAKTKDGTEY